MAAGVAGAGIKLAPGIDPEALPAEGELEFISLGRRLVEAVLWVGELASQLGARKLDERIAYLTSDSRLHSLFARRFRVHAWLPFSERRLFEQLRSMGAGRVEVMRRGSPVETNPLERRLNEALLGGSDLFTVALTRLRDTHIALVLERERD